MRTAAIAACLIFVASQAAGKHEGLQAFRKQTKASLEKCAKIAAAIVVVNKLRADGSKYGGTLAKAAYQKAVATARPEAAKVALKRLALPFA